MSEEITVREATRKLGITIDALYRLVYADKLPARKLGRRWMIEAAAVERRLKDRQDRQS
jgi:excisionase family DNA binding protein